MNLFEFEGKQLLASAGIAIPKSQLITTPEAKVSLEGEVALKAQVLSGKRFKRGLVRIIPSTEVSKVAKELFDLKEVDGEKIENILIEEKVTGIEHYLSITYDTSSRSPVLLYSGSGGVEIENEGKVDRHVIDPLGAFAPKLPKPQLNEVASKMWELFKTKDLRVCEINPLMETAAGFVAADSKIIVDDDGLFRQEEFKDYPPRQLIGHEKSEREIAAGKIDETDYRGSAGSVYYDLDGDIAVLASGGGASVVAMDALLGLGGKPANYTEYSGNPPKEKVEKLTQIALSKPGLKGCWVVGGTANFTDIYETLSGFLEGLRRTDPKPTYPIVIRRGGPRDEEAFAMLKEAAKNEGWDFHIYGPDTPMTETAQTVVDLAYGSQQ